ncbi:hypothetical protein BZA05DRAFT_344590 [Tricharina praecox]|uniref:uncharacterized protein n=1 Tax=Tricharina praecox TaxID=43433 RepID=UPI00222112B3|nr:uncharacterized protein BZA05DRAFT_345195 [Tricharina praecox]XP_051334973.1 uncharacterized protein BZA05DRAFT_344590 [Tricharina praecox]KAI5840644.1 hypothetical protein BZA05DRAFT_345195 [Tricharina praecox]KAI5842072.1 hypothetical protein BZA05DRAFT_344590 [Tricharina praecox]
MRGYGGHGGRAQDQRPAGYGQDSERDVRGYPRPSDDERGSGYSGHGGRAQEQGRATYGEDSERDVRGYSREEAQRDVPAGREYRAGAGANTAQEYYSGASGEYRGAVEVAERESSESGSLFSSALKMLSGSQARKDDVDEDEVVNTHKQVYGGGNTGQLGSQSLGQAAAMQALKHFTGGSGGSSGGAAAGGQNAFIGMAMAEAVKLFDTQRAQGNVAPTETKQDVVGQAAQFALKLFLKSKMDAATGGSGGGGGAGLMGLAQQFLMK